MHHKLYLSLNGYSLRCLLSIFFISLLLRADAQHRKDPWATYGGGGNGSSAESGYAIAVNVDYDAPAGILANTFNPAPAFNIGVLHYLGNFTFNATIGYHVYNPKQAVFTYDDGAGGTGVASYDKYDVIAVYAGAVYNVQLAGTTRFYIGLNWGIYGTHYSYAATDQFSSNSIDLNEEQLYFAPKLGFNFILSGNISLGLEAKYNFFTPEGNSDTNPDVGTYYKSYAAGLMLTYKL